ncbi:MAG: hypothetical protein ABI460_11640 [Caldimonas sp.]
MTRLNSLQSAALVTLTAAATTLLIQACGGNAEAQTASDANPIEGVWESAVTIKDCTSGAIVRTFKGETLFHRGGSLSADNSLPVPSRGASYGNWKQGVGTSYTANFRFLRFNPDGSLAGSQKVSRSLTLSSDMNTLTGTLTGQVFDTADVVLQPICGSETAVRIY